SSFCSPSSFLYPAFLSSKGRKKAPCLPHRLRIPYPPGRREPLPQPHRLRSSVIEYEDRSGQVTHEPQHAATGSYAPETSADLPSGPLPLAVSTGSLARLQTGQPTFAHSGDIHLSVRCAGVRGISKCDIYSTKTPPLEGGVR